MSGWICTATLDAQQEDDHSPKTGRVNNIMDVEQHGENQMRKPGGTFCLHTFITHFYLCEDFHRHNILLRPLP